MEHKFHEHKKQNELDHRRFEEINLQQQQMIDKLIVAVFGDKELDELGMKKQVEEIYMWLKTGKLGYAGLLRFFAFIAALSGAVSGVWFLIKKIIK